MRACVRTLRLPSSETNEHTRKEEKKTAGSTRERKKGLKKKSRMTAFQNYANKKKSRPKRSTEYLVNLLVDVGGVKAIVAFFPFSSDGQFDYKDLGRDVAAGVYRLIVSHRAQKEK